MFSLGCLSFSDGRNGRTGGRTDGRMYACTCAHLTFIDVFTGMLLIFGRADGRNGRTDVSVPMCTPYIY